MSCVRNLLECCAYTQRTTNTHTHTTFTIDIFDDSTHLTVPGQRQQQRCYSGGWLGLFPVGWSAKKGEKGEAKVVGTGILYAHKRNNGAAYVG